MLVVTGIFDNERFIPDRPVSIPPKKKVTITIDDAVTETSTEKKPDGKIRLTKSMLNEMLQDEDVRFLTGLLHTEMTADEIRTERLKKHDCIN
jgi:flagellar basal body rod protein FlgF